MNTHNVVLDLSKEEYSGQIVRIGQGDSSGTTIVASVYDNGIPVTLTGMTAKFMLRMPRSKGYFEDSHCNVSGNTITYVVDEEHCAVFDGYTDDAYFQIASGSILYSTARFRMKILKAASKDVDPAGSYSDDIVSATNAAREAANDAREAMEEIGTAVEDAAQAAESAAQAVEDAQTAIEDADTAKREATSAANAATAAANNANSKANLANTAANNANAATTATNSATQRAEAAIAAMGDISEQAVPVMSADIRGGARIQPDSGLEITDTDNLQVRLALESDGYARGGLAEVTAKGHAEQASTTGKNLLQVDGISRVINDVTVTTANGTITLNGTAIRSGGRDKSLSALHTLDAGTYVISANIPADVYFFVQSDDNLIIANIWSSGPSASFTLQDETSVYVGVNVTQGVTYSDTRVSNIMLRLASITDDTYEPYTGGAPSPSPEFPQTIEVVRGRNLLDESTATVGKRVNGNTGALETAANQNASDFIPVEPNTNYYLMNSIGASSSYAAVAYDANKNYLRYLPINGSGVQSGVINTGAGAAYVRVNYLNETDSRYVGQSQLTLGSTPQPYVPYGHVGMECVGSLYGRNLFRGNYVPLDKPIPQGSSIIASSYTSGTEYIYLYRKDGTQIDYWMLGSVTGQSYKSRTLDVPEDVYSVRFSGYDGTYNVQIEHNNGTGKATEYDPWFYDVTPIPLPSRGWVAGLPDGTAESLRLDGAGKCEWTLPTKMQDLGELTWQYDAVGFFFTLSLSNDIRRNFSNYQVKLPVLCSHYIDSDMYINTTDASWFANTPDGSTTIHQGGSASSAFLYVKDSRFTSASDFSTWLSTHNVTILYSLAMPVIEECGYVEDWLTDIPEGAVITIPELDEVGIKYFIDSAVTELARQWYARAHSEYADRITALEQAVADLATS